MYSSNLELNGFVFTPYFQFHKDISRDELNSGELLTRIQGGSSAATALKLLGVAEHLYLLEWLISISIKLRESRGIYSSINVDNRVIVNLPDRHKFIELATSSLPMTSFEFTETSVMPDSADANRIFWKLRDQGLKCVLDDFGTGFNGMTLLTDYDFDVVKIDQTLVRDVDARLEKLKTVSLLREMLSVLNKEHVVEGVETQAIFELLVKARFRVFQGFLFHIPVPVSRILLEGAQKEDG